VDGTQRVTRAELVAALRLISNHPDLHVLDRFPLKDDADSLSKKDFIRLCRETKFMDPVVAYQKRVRRLAGGISSWKSLTRFRKTTFAHLHSDVRATVW
jgi:hypothetical protein